MTTNNLPTYIYNGFDFFVTQKVYIEDNDLYDEESFKTLSIQQKLRYNMIYFYKKDLVEGFIIG